MNPVSDTAFLTCGARALDAALPFPVCGDIYAERFINDHARRVLALFRRQGRQRASIVVRHRLIDDLLRARLAADPDTSVILVGAGFDTRAFRLDGGHWTEIDEPAVIAHKEAVLPASDCPNSLARIAIEFAQERLADRLPLAAPPVVVVMEGVSMYLDEEQTRDTLQALLAAYPGHTLICDLVTRTFMARYGRKLTKQVNKLGAEFAGLSEAPLQRFEAAGYRLARQESLVARSFEMAGETIKLAITRTLFRSALKGYTVNVLEAPVRVPAGA
ncbi:MAG: SAM-dependent methyltransferase [Pseudomonadota bacterium]